MLSTVLDILHYTSEESVCLNFVMLPTLNCNRKSSPSSTSDENYDPAKSQYSPVRDACWSQSSKYVNVKFITVCTSLSVCSEMCVVCVVCCVSAVTFPLVSVSLSV